MPIDLGRAGLYVSNPAGPGGVTLGGEGGLAITNPANDEGGLVTGLILDFDAALGFSSSAWVDQTGTQPNAVQATTLKQPTQLLVDPTFNNHASLAFLAASSQNMVSATWGAGYAAFTLYLVAQAGAGLQWVLDSTSASEISILYDGNSHNEFDMSDGGTIASRASGASTNPGVIAAVFNGVGTSKLYDSANTAVFSGALLARTLQSMTIGSSYNTANFLNGKIARILAYPTAHSAANVATNLAALGTKYGISIGA